MTSRHSGVEIDGKSQSKHARFILSSQQIVCIGALLFDFHMTIPKAREAVFQVIKTRYLSGLLDREASNPITSATPSATDVRVGEWIIHGIALITRSSIVEAASKSRTGKAVALKRLMRQDAHSADRIEREIAVYENLKNPLLNHRDRRFVMQMNCAIFKQDQRTWLGEPDEAFILWEPLGQITFASFSHDGQHFFHPLSEQVISFASSSLRCELSMNNDGFTETSNRRTHTLSL